MTVSTTHFVNSLRVRPEIIRLANEQAPLVWTVRVQAAEVWDAVRIEATPGTRVCDVKQAAMASQSHACDSGKTVAKTESPTAR